MLRQLGSVIVVALALDARAALATPAVADPLAAPALLFAERCSTCHNLGGGVKVGPDLVGVVDRRDKAWFTRFVRGPSALIDAGDKFAAELFRTFQPVRMPDQPLTDTEVDGVWAYFTDCTKKGGCVPVATGPRWGIDATDQEIEFGRALFLGERHLQRGGAPCFACHGARRASGARDDLGMMGGGTLGPNLTFAYARLGEKTLTPLLAQMETPVMHAVYEGAPLEENEQFALKAYLAQLSRDGTTPRRERDFFVLGLEGMGIVLGGFTLRARARGADRARKEQAA